MTSDASTVSSSVNARGKPIRSACWRRMLSPSAWNVPPRTRSQRPSSRRPARASISAAARRVNVRRAICSAGVPVSTRYATR